VGVPRLLGRFFLRTITRMMGRYIYIYSVSNVRGCTCACGLRLLFACYLFTQSVRFFYFEKLSNFEVSPSSLVSFLFSQVMAVHKRVSTPRDIGGGFRFQFSDFRFRFEFRCGVCSGWLVVTSTCSGAIATAQAQRSRNYKMQSEPSL